MNLFISDITQRFEPFSKMTQRIEPSFAWLKDLSLLFFFFFLKKWPSRIEPSFSTWLKELNLLFQHDWKNWTFFLHWLKELILFKKYDLQELKLLKNMTQRIEPLFLWLKDVNILSVWLKELNFFFSKKKIQLKELNLFWIWRKEFNPFFLTMTQRIQPSFLEYDAKNWTSFFNVTLRIEPLFFWYY